MAQGSSWGSRSAAVRSQGIKPSLHLGGEERLKSSFPTLVPSPWLLQHLQPPLFLGGCKLGTTLPWRRSDGGNSWGTGQKNMSKETANVSPCLPCRQELCLHCPQGPPHCPLSPCSPPAQPSSLRCLVWNDPKQPPLFQFSQCRAETAPKTNTTPVAFSLMWPKRAFFPSKCGLMGRSCSAFLLVNYTQIGQRCLPVSGCPNWDLEISKRDHSSFTSRLFLPSCFRAVNAGSTGARCEVTAP